MNLSDIDEFQEMMLKYSFALQKLNTEINILIDEYNFNYNYNPIEHIKTRIKNIDSIKSKLKKHNVEFNVTNIKKYIHDVVGMRIVCSFLSDVYEIVHMIKSSHEFVVKEESDYIKNPKDTGYSSYHINVLVPVHLLNNVEFIEAEIQIRTIAMDCWASLDHKLCYKLPDDLPEEIKNDLESRAKEIRELDKNMQYLYEIVKKYKYEHAKAEDNR